MLVKCPVCEGARRVTQDVEGHIKPALHCGSTCPTCDGKGYLEVFPQRSRQWEFPGPSCAPKPGPSEFK